MSTLSVKRTPSGGPCADPDVVLAKLQARNRVVLAARRLVEFWRAAPTGKYSPTIGKQLEEALQAAVEGL
jgi:hypothetical protein